MKEYYKGGKLMQRVVAKLEEEAAERLALLDIECQNNILEFYPEHKQRNAALGVLRFGVDRDIKKHITNCVNQHTKLKKLLSNCKNVQEIRSIVWQKILPKKSLMSMLVGLFRSF